MQIDMHAFEQTAKAVYMMNKHARDKYACHEGVLDFMVSMAYKYAGDATSFSTGGFHLSFYKCSANRDEIGVTASVQAYTALKYAESESKRIDAIRAAIA